MAKKVEPEEVAVIERAIFTRDEYAPLGTETGRLYLARRIARALRKAGYIREPQP